MVWKFWSVDPKGQVKSKCSNKDVELQAPTTPTLYSDVRVLAAIFIALSCVLGVTNIVVGAVFFHDCPSESHVPDFVLIVGVSGIINGLLLIHTLVKRDIRCAGCMPIYLIVHTALHILESLFVYVTWRMSKQTGDSQSDTKIDCSDLFINIAGMLLACGWGLIIMQGVWICLSFTKDEGEKEGKISENKK